MDIFKLFFEHDLRLEELRERSSGNSPNTELSIEDFMKPDSTYSKLYFTGTRLKEERFGLNQLEHYPKIRERLNRIFSELHFTTFEGSYSKLDDALNTLSIGEAVLISKENDHGMNPEELRVRHDSNVGHFKTELADVLSADIHVLYKEQSHHGFDLHLFSKKNMYDRFFYPLKELVGPSFRFFSINGKRIRSERKFYFETWTLDNPPHGAEEVRPETVL